MHKTLTMLLTVLFLSIGALAQAELIGNLGGVPFKPQVVKLSLNGSITEDGVKFETYELVFRSEKDIFARLSASVAVAVPGGKLPDGRTFRKLANTPTDRQPSVSEGLPEVQGWSIEDRESGFRRTSVFSEQGKLQVTFGKRQGKSIKGKISLIVPPGPDDKPNSKPSTLEGDFTAVIE